MKKRGRKAIYNFKPLLKGKQMKEFPESIKGFQNSALKFARDNGIKVKTLVMEKMVMVIPV